MIKFMEEALFAQRMHNLSLEEGTQLETYKRLRKFSQEVKKVKLDSREDQSSKR